MSIVRSIKQTMRDNNIRKQYIKVEEAIKAKAQLISDLEFHRTMSNFYTERVLDINPHQDWWNFAEAKQKQYDHQMDFTRLEKRIEEADAKVQAQKQAFLASQKEIDNA